MNFSPTILSTSAAAATAGIAAWGAVAPSSQLFGPTLRHTSSPRKIALTFDDGPNPAVTPRLLELFDRYSVRATFFLIGKFVRECPGLVQEISCAAIKSQTIRTHMQIYFSFRPREFAMN